MRVKVGCRFGTASTQTINQQWRLVAVIVFLYYLADIYGNPPLSSSVLTKIGGSHRWITKWGWCFCWLAGTAQPFAYRAMEINKTSEKNTENNTKVG